MSSQITYNNEFSKILVQDTENTHTNAELKDFLEKINRLG